MAWKVSRWPGMFPDSLECFHLAWKVSRWHVMFPDGLKSFQMAWKVSRWSGSFLCFTKTFQVYKNFPGSIATLLPWFFRLWAGPEKSNSLEGALQLYRWGGGGGAARGFPYLPDGRSILFNRKILGAKVSYCNTLRQSRPTNEPSIAWATWRCIQNYIQGNTALGPFSILM